MEDPESVSIHTNVTYNNTRKIHQVHSQVTFLRPQLLTIRCEASNERGARARDIRLVNSSECNVCVCEEGVKASV